MSASSSQSQNGNYRVIRILGEGNDTVESIEYEGQILVLKISNPKYYGMLNLNEVDIPSRVIHPHILRVETTLPRTHESRNKGFGITTKQLLGDLHNNQFGNVMTWELKMRLVYRLAYTLNLLHRDNICHLDIKPSNIGLIDSKDAAYIDFGSARSLDKTGTYRNRSLVATVSYAPPELLYDQKDEPYIYGKHSDVWALALTLLYILTNGRVIYPNFDFWNDRAPTAGWLGRAFRKTSMRYKIFHDRLATAMSEAFQQGASTYWHDDPIKMNIRKDIEALSRIFSDMTKLVYTKRITLDEVMKNPVWDRFRSEPIPDLIHLEPSRTPEVYRLPDDFKQDLRVIISYFVHAKSHRIRTMYLAVDILYRSIYLVDTTPGELRDMIRLYFVVAATFIAVNVLEGYSEKLADDLMNGYKINDKDYLKFVIDAIVSKALTGIIHPKFLFDVIPIQHYKTYVASHLFNPEAYLKISIPQIEELMKFTPPDPLFQAKTASPRVSEILTVDQWKQIVENS
jgi:serine/threonine protein kinase